MHWVACHRQSRIFLELEGSSQLHLYEYFFFPLAWISELCFLPERLFVSTHFKQANVGRAHVPVSYAYYELDRVDQNELVQREQHSVVLKHFHNSTIK